MILSDFTSAAEIRAVLGVADTELTDDVLALPLYVRQLTFDLEDVATNLVTEYLAVWALPAGSRTVAQQRLFDLVQLYSSFSVSKMLLTSMPLFAPRTITDGRATVERQTDVFQDVRDGVFLGYTTVRRKLLDTYNLLTGATSVVALVPGLTVAVGLAVDPITGA